MLEPVLAITRRIMQSGTSNQFKGIYFYSTRAGGGNSAIAEPQSSSQCCRESSTPNETRAHDAARSPKMHAMRAPPSEH